MVRRSLPLLAVWFVLALGLAQAAPNRPRYEPPDAPKPAPRFDLRGTTWQGQDHTPNHRITFHADGTLTYGINDKKYQKGSSWTFDGKNLYFEVNEKYREFKG